MTDRTAAHEIKETAATAVEIAPLAGALWIISLALSLAGLIVFLWIAREMAEGDLRRLDYAIRGALHAHATPALTLVMQAVSNFGSVPFLALQTLVMFAIFVVQKWRRASVLLIGTMIGAGALDIGLKLIFHRARPEAFFIPLPHSYSFPSGHAIGSTCFYGITARLWAARARTRAGKTGIWMAAIVTIVLIGVSRIYLGVHWPSDVLAGYIAGATWVLSLLVVGSKFRKKRA